jgi:hypothetical protein
MHADIHHYPRRSKGLTGEEAEFISGVTEESQFFHESLGVEGPTFAVTRSPGLEAVESALAVRFNDGRCAL